MVDEDHTFPKYNDARNKFLNASGTFQNIIFSKGLNKDLNIPDYLQYVSKPEYLIDPTASPSWASFFSSTEQMKKVAPQVVDIINNIKDKDLAKEDLQKLEEVKKQMNEAKLEAEESQQNELEPSIVSKIFNKFKGLWDRIKSKLDRIVDRIKGITGALRFTR